MIERAQRFFLFIAFLIPFIEPFKHGTQPTYVAELLVCALWLIYLAISYIAKPTLQFNWHTLIPLLTLAGGIVIHGAAIIKLPVFFLFLIAIAGMVVVSSGTEEEKDRLFDAFTAAIAVAAAVNSISSFAQAFKVSDNFDPLLFHSAHYYIQGQIAQANQLGNILTLGLFSLAWLRYRGHVTPVTFFAGALLIASALIIDSSRSVTLYMVSASGLAFLFRKKLPAQLCTPLLIVVLIWVAATLIVQNVVGGLEQFGLLSGTDRALADASSGIRVELYRLTATILKEHWLLGVGFHQLSTAYFDYAAHHQLPILSNRSILNHSHNIFLNIFVELGLIGIVALVAFCIFVVLQIKKQHTPRMLIVSTLLMVELIHSMLEYPLWYTYFFLPTAFLVAISTESGPIVKLSRSAKYIVAGIFSVGAGYLLLSAWGYTYITILSHPPQNTEAFRRNAKAIGAFVSDPVLGLPAEQALEAYLAGQTHDPAFVNLLVEDILPYEADPKVMLLQADGLERAGKASEAAQIRKSVSIVYGPPKHKPDDSLANQPWEKK